MERIQIELKNEKTGTYAIISWLVIALNICSFLYYGAANLDGNRWKAFVAAAILLVPSIYFRLSKKKRTYHEFFYVASFVISFFWISLENYIFAGANLLLFIFQDISRRKLVVQFFNDRIIYPAFPKKIIHWQELNNVILKDDVLTIDLRTNKVLQNDIVTRINESEFNEFCRQRLMAVNK